VRIVFDTNVLIAAVVASGVCRDLLEYCTENHELVTSDYILGELREKLERDLRLHPRDLGYEQNLWDGKLLSHHLRQRYATELGVRQCQRLFRSLGFRRRKPRPVIAQADPEAQRAFKKTRRAGRKPGA